VFVAHPCGTSTFREFAKPRNEEVNRVCPRRVRPFRETSTTRASRHDVSTNSEPLCLPYRIEPNQLLVAWRGGPDGLHRPTGQLGKLAWGGSTTVLQEHNHLVHHRIAEQATQARFTVSSFIHRRRWCTAKRLSLSRDLRRFENSRNVELT